MKPTANDADKLARADRDIAEVEGRVAQQVAFIESLTLKGLDTVLAERLLRLLRYDLGVLRTQRRVLLDGREAAVCRSRSRPEPRTHRRRRTPGLPGSGERGRDAQRADASAVGPILTWESLPNRALVARTEDHLLVVRPTGGKKGAFRFAVMRPLPANGGLVHVAVGAGATAREAMLAAERAVPPPPAVPAFASSPPAPGPSGWEGHRAYPLPEALRVRRDPGAVGKIEAPPAV